MAQNTNLNVTPYYDDFDKDKNFYRVLFRPGFPIQARELTTMQSILQNQIENVGSHLFKDGAMVIPGQVGYDLNVDAIMVQESFLGANVEEYRTQLNGRIIEGLTTGVKAKVLYSISDTESEKGYLTFYVKYIESGGDESEQQSFKNNEQLITDKEITFGSTLIEVGSPFAQLLPTDALQSGSAAYIQNGVYFVRGFFVDVNYQYLLLDQYGNNPSYRVGLAIQESIITPEDDSSLNDNAAGTSNYAAPGAHRFRITTTLVKKELDDDADKNFLELLRLNDSKVEKIVDRAVYSELEKSLATRTYEESGDYVVEDFEVVLRESLDDGENDGIYDTGETTADGNTAADSLYALEFGPGTAYVKGYRISTLSPTYVDLDKPRDTAALENTNIGFELGNHVTVDNIWGFPNFTGSTVTNSYQIVRIHDAFTATPGTAAGNIIGYARALAMEHLDDVSGGFGTSTDKYKLNLFDIQMTTAFKLAASKSYSQGTLVTGGTSGARGYVALTTSSSDELSVIQVEGSFNKGEDLLVDGILQTTISEVYDYSISDARSYSCVDSGNNIDFTADAILEDILQLQGSSFVYDATSGSEDITGLQSNFNLDLQPGDRIFFNKTKYVDVIAVDPGALDTTNVDDTFDFAAQTVKVTPPASDFPTAGTYNGLVRYRNRLNDIENANLLSEMPKRYVKTISDESMVVRRTFDDLNTATNSVSITLPEGEQFESISDTNYTITVLSAQGGASYSAGDEIPLNTTNSGNFGYVAFTTSERTTLQITNLTLIDTIKVTATVSKNTVQKKTKSAAEMKVLRVNKTTQDLKIPLYNLTYADEYGTRIEDRDISLGVSDVYRLHAVYESTDENDPIIPSVTLVEPVFFKVGTTVKGATSGAIAKVVNFNAGNLKLTLVYVDGIFQAGETISGIDTNNDVSSAIISDADGSIVVGSNVITDDYFLEVNQTDYLYDISKIIRKKDAPVPIRKIVAVYDYYTHSATGDYFAGQSYLNTDYADIPFYEDQFLADYLDFRPAVGPKLSGTGSVSSPAQVITNTFDFNSRSFTTGGSNNATVFDVPKINDNFKCDFDWYLPRTDKAFLTPEGDFRIIKGKSAEEPEEPDDLSDAMLLAVINHKPYGFDPENDAAIVTSDHKRYTMKDIGVLERRLDQVEYYTSLNLLESDAMNTKILDANGKDRLKNGFFVDDFSDHGKSDTSNEDFGASLDFEEGTCRASHYTTNVSLEINTTLSSHVKYDSPITGDSEDDDEFGNVVTLPYTEKLIVNQPYASRVENVNPFNVFAYIGRIDLVPSSDDWVSTRRLPTRVTRIEGDFQQTASELRVDQNGFAPIQWRAWRTTWRGRRTISSRVVRNRGWLRQDRGRSPRPRVWGGRGMRRINRVRRIRTTRRQVRTGVRTRVVPRIDRRNLGDSLVSQTAIPWIRSRNIRITAARLKPRTRFYTYFDSRGINSLITPKMLEVIKDPSVDSRTNSTPFVPGELVRGQRSRARMRVARPNSWYTHNPYDDQELPTSYASTTNFVNLDVYSSALQTRGRYFGNFQVGEVIIGQNGARAVVRRRRHITDRFGKYRGTFFIPPAHRSTNRRWRTGKRLLRMTSESGDSRIPGTVASAAETEYEASGTLRRIRRNVLAVRNARVVRDTVTQRRTVRSVRTETRQIGWYDPLAQSFISDEQGGIFVTSVEIYFRTKDATIPISMQIRTMENGYPTTSILPFSDVTLQPDEVQISDTGAIATKFVFQAPVYIPQSIEHCFVLLSDSNEYQVWISRMGELDITGDRTISEQPYAGVLFKSQNASTWTADQYEDLKFKLYRASFDTSSSGTLVLNNTELQQGNNGVLELRSNPIRTKSPVLDLTLNASRTYTIGARIYQTTGSTVVAQGTVVSSNGTALQLNDITGTWDAGSVNNNVVTRGIKSSKTLATLTLTSAGVSGTVVAGDTVTGDTSGETAVVVTYNSSASPPTIEVETVSGDFTAQEGLTLTNGTATLNATTDPTYSGDSVSGGSVQSTYPNAVPTYASSNRRITVLHSNHGMHDASNNVTITGVKSEVTSTTLTASISSTDLTLSVNDASAFHTTINGANVGTDNVGYIKLYKESEGLEDTVGEIVSYSAISSDGKTITLVERGLDDTTAASHGEETEVQCYNLDGIPLTEINKTHTSVTNPTLDSYELTTTSIAKVGIQNGGDDVEATQNVQFEILVPQIESMLLPKTTVTAQFNGISGTSINDGSTLSQSSFSNDGIYRDITLSEDNEFAKPFLICSKDNESAELSGVKSFRLNVTLTSEQENISPVIDIDRMSMTCVSSRINNPSDTSGALLPAGDPHDAVYISRVADLTNPSGSIKVYFEGWRPPNSTIKVLYRVRPVGASESIESLGWNYFDDADATIPETSELEVFSEYQYEVTGLEFNQYQLKILFVSPNQAYSPIIKDLRAIALAV